MKTKLTQMLALTVIAFIMISTGSKGAHAAETIKVTELKEVKHISKIVVTGNVDVYITQGYEENLKVYDDYYSKNALVQWENGVLRISSYENKKLAIWITVTNLSAIEASGNAVIRSMNKLSGINLDINLTNGAKANVEAQVVNLNTVVADSSRLELSGDAESQAINMRGMAQLEASAFTAQNQSIVMSDNAAASFNQNGKTTQLKTMAGPLTKNETTKLIAEE
jgi:Putative auto-transporter adhesin, head GIN domain